MNISQQKKADWGFYPHRDAPMSGHISLGIIPLSAATEEGRILYVPLQIGSVQGIQRVVMVTSSVRLWECRRHCGGVSAFANDTLGFGHHPQGGARHVSIPMPATRNNQKFKRRWDTRRWQIRPLGTEEAQTFALWCDLNRGQEDDSNNRRRGWTLLLLSMIRDAGHADAKSRLRGPVGGSNRRSASRSPQPQSRPRRA